MQERVGGGGIVGDRGGIKKEIRGKGRGRKEAIKGSFLLHVCTCGLDVTLCEMLVVTAGED